MPTKQPATFRALPPIMVEPRASLAAPSVQSTSSVVDDGGGRDHWTGLPAQGPRQIMVTVTGGRMTLRPTDREAAFDLMAAHSSLGRTYDHKRRAWTYALDEMLRHGALEWASLSMVGEMSGLDLVLDPAADLAIERYQRHVRRQTRPIPRVVWTDDAPHASSDDQVAVVFAGRSQRRT